MNGKTTIPVPPGKPGFRVVNVAEPSAEQLAARPKLNIEAIRELCRNDDYFAKK